MTESNRIEYKRELIEGLEKEAVAFLNYHDGGLIYLGIGNNGEAIGIADPDAIQLAVKDRLKNNIQPSALGLFDVILEQRDAKHIIKIIVASGSEKPYYLRKFGMSEKGCFMNLEYLAYMNLLNLNRIILIALCSILSTLFPISDKNKLNSNSVPTKPPSNAD